MIFVFKPSIDTALMMRFLAAFSVAAIAAGASLAWATTPRLLNKPREEGQDLLDIEFSAEAGRVVYWANQDNVDMNELYSVPVEGGEPVKLNGPLPEGGGVGDSIFVRPFRISPDGKRVVYFGDQDTVDVIELYSVPIEGGAPPIKLSGPMVDGGGIWITLNITPDSKRVIYAADQEEVGVYNLYSSPIEGGGSVRLNANLAPGRELRVFPVISPDSQWVLYEANHDSEDAFELYIVPIAGGTPRKVNGPLVEGGNVYAYQFSPDSSRVVYGADQETDDMYELYSVPVGGGTPVKLNGEFVPGGDFTKYQISSTHSRVVYQADQELDGKEEVYSVPIDGGEAVKLNHPLPDDRFASIHTPWDQYRVSPDASRVVYAAETEDSFLELFSVPIDGSAAAAKLNTPLTYPDGHVPSLSRIAPDGSRVLFRAENNGKAEIYSAPAEGGDAIKLHGPLSGGETSYYFNILPDGSRVFFTALQAADGVADIYSSPVDEEGAWVKHSDGLFQASRYRTNSFLWITKNVDYAVFTGRPMNSSYGVYALSLKNSARQWRDYK